MLRVNRVVNWARASISNYQYLLSHDPKISCSPPPHFTSKPSIRFFDIYKLASKEKMEKERARLKSKLPIAFDASGVDASKLVIPEASLICLSFRANFQAMVDS
ncbi:hypothetical protein CXB51_019345 [Gossypium anomalum]|uniref:Uncharacterized protein n=1 Tax=Gossypium anomalum TaxID=47600 RepID=A0A8J5ZDF1_9ROSI|nr:hypothetical protein CXB51_019345 [Gossypium anomalum]